MSTTMKVERAVNATVQDLGRPGYAWIGVSGGGAADQHAARTANVLVGNADTPLIEVTGTELAVRLDHDALVAVTGAADELRIDGRRCPAWELTLVPAHAEISTPAPTRGLRSYLAVNGGVGASTVLGSVAPDPLIGLDGRLAPGTELPVANRLARLPRGQLPLLRLGAAGSEHRRAGPVPIAYTAGPDLDRLSSEVDPLGGTFRVGPQSNSVGLRLEGDSLSVSAGEEILSRGVPVGAIEVPRDGGVIVLLRARMVTAGYPVIGVATTAALDRLGQLRPGDDLRFEPVSVHEAVAELRAAQDVRVALAARVRSALTARGLASAIDPGHGDTTSERQP